MKILDIGCGEKRKKGAIGFDIRKTAVTDIVGDATSLPFKDEEFDHIYSSHLIEHFSHREVRTVLKEWIRCLKGGALLRFAVLGFVFEPFYFS